MNFFYDKKSDSLYIELSEKPSFDSAEISDGLVVDYDKSGQVVGLDIEYASKHFNMSKIHVEGFNPLVDIGKNA
ncbi:MAG: DUF2283 domain-containing protein [Rickettsiales bacterium]|jgi:uncharacterized protein YuzE|nr:DUF2283 domain-containing protein [Rickettsiales bacterium]